jgi:hypothetical protein
MDSNTKINHINLMNSRYKSMGKWCLEDFNNRKNNIIRINQNNLGLDFEQKTYRKYLNKFADIKKMNDSFSLDK